MSKLAYRVSSSLSNMYSLFIMKKFYYFWYHIKFGGLSENYALFSKIVKLLKLFVICWKILLMFTKFYYFWNIPSFLRKYVNFKKTLLFLYRIAFVILNYFEKKPYWKNNRKKIYLIQSFGQSVTIFRLLWLIFFLHLFI